MTDWLTTRPIAHRGLHNPTTLIENSLEAFQAAIDYNYPIELDLHLSKDGEVIVFHDHHMQRLTGKNAYIWDLTLPEIKALKLGATNATIPTLKEVLDLVKGQVPLLIEIKSVFQVGILEETLCTLLKPYDHEYAIQSFNPFVLEWFAINAPHILRGQLSYDYCDCDEPMPFHKKYTLRRLGLNHRSKPDFIGYDHTALPFFWVDKELKKRGIPLLAWTVKSQGDYQKIAPHVDNIIFESWRA